ncbi:MAG: hypothetical protein K8R88_12170 [Armatimonadetes bacterium]|nr:hypothetical protein [Armatimonadota bacterium]
MNSKMTLLVVTSITATVLTGCGGARKDCVDQNGNPLPNSACNGGRVGAGIYPRYIYGGSRGSNGRITGGSLTAPSSGTSRGGFGGSSFSGS